jgi:hypothetical protein
VLRRISQRLHNVNFMMPLESSAFFYKRKSRPVCLSIDFTKFG